MPTYETLGELLMGQSERKLQKMRDGITTEINRLGIELKFVDDALAKKRSRSGRSDAQVRPANGGRPVDGLPRSQLLQYVVEVGHPVTVADMRAVLAGKGIVRRAEAIRNSLVRLETDGKLVRTPDRKFAVALRGDGAKVEAEHPLSGDSTSEVVGAN